MNSQPSRFVSSLPSLVLFLVLCGPARAVTMQSEVLPDPGVPLGFLVLNGGSTFTTEPMVEAELRLWDNRGRSRDFSGYAVELSSDQINWTKLDMAPPPARWTLPAGAGLKRVYARVTNPAGRRSGVMSDTITLLDAPPSADVIQLRTDWTRWVQIMVPGRPERWRNQMPEYVDTATFHFISWQESTVDWQLQPDGRSIGYTFRHTPEFEMEQKLPAGAEFTLRLTPNRDTVDMAMTVSNVTGSTTFRDMSCDGGCFQHLSKPFQDVFPQTRTFIRTAAGITPLSKIERSREVRCRYTFAGMPAVPDLVNGFWGTTITEATGGWIATTNETGDFVAAIAWRNAREILQNSDQHHCTHSSWHIGDLAPGASVSNTGRMYFLAGSVDDFVKRYEADFNAP